MSSIMSIGKNGASQSVSFKSGKNDRSHYENPVSRSTERNLAVLSSIGGAAAMGALAGGITTFLFPIGDGVKRTFQNSKWPLIIGLATASLVAVFTMPAKIYSTKVNAFVRKKEMDVFTRDRDLKSNLTEEVGEEVKDKEVSLDKKLDDNLKLQMANRGTALGIANITAQPQE